MIARLFLAAILVVAGVAKAADPAGARRALIGFGITEKLARTLGWCLPFAEIGVALALIALNTAWFGAIGALALMLMFAGAIGVSLLRGRTPECNCFGQLHSEPVSWSMFSRNLVLAAIAALIVVRGKAGSGANPLDWLADLRTGQTLNLLISLIALGLLIAAVVYLRRVLNQQSKVLERIDAVEKLVEEYAPPPVEREEASAPPEGLPVGAPAPDFSLPSIGGEKVSLRSLLAPGKSVLLLFTSPNCAPCESILQDVRAWERDYSDQLTIALLSKGSPRDNEKRVAKYGARHLLLVGESQVAESYEGKWTPAAVLISPNGRIASPNVYGDEAIRGLISAAVSKNHVRADGASKNGHKLQIAVGDSTLKVGDPAPNFSIPDLEGEAVNTRDLRGADTLLLFWNPDCPFCIAMSDDIKRWEENPPAGAPRLLVVASGDKDKVDDASKDFETRFLYDAESQVGPLFGTRSTPSAVLIDRDGRIASSVATGALKVMALAGVRMMTLPIAHVS